MRSHRKVSEMDTTVCQSEPLLAESGTEFYDRSQIEKLVSALSQALEAATHLSERFEKHTLTAREIIAVRLAVARVVGATMNLQPHNVRQTA